MTTYGATSDDKVVKLTIFCFQCIERLQWVQYIPRINTLRQIQNGLHFVDDIFKCIFLNQNVWISIKISLKFVPKFRINIIPAMVQIMAWRWSGDKPLFEPMVVSLLRHICVTRPRWVMYMIWTLLCFVVVKYHPILPISFRVTSQALGQSYDCPSASEVTLKDISKSPDWTH